MQKKLPRVSTKGYVLQGDKAQILLFHGYTGSPYDLKPLAIFLNNHGFAVHVPLLKGHGSHEDALKNITAKDWHRQARKELAKLDPKRSVYIGGLSMGACLALTHAKDLEATRALLLISPALSLKISAEILISAARLGFIPKDYLLPKLSGTSDIADPIARAKCPSYANMPINGLLEFDTLRMRAREELPTIKLPIFMGFGRLDSVISISECSNYILHSAQLPVISQFYSRSKHVLTLDYDNEKLAYDILDFINNYEEPTV